MFLVVAELLVQLVVVVVVARRTHSESHTYTHAHRLIEVQPLLAARRDGHSDGTWRMQL